MTDNTDASSSLESTVLTDGKEVENKDKSLLADAGTEIKKDGEADKGKDTQGDKAKLGAPEKYVDFKIPEGMEIDKDLLEKSVPVLKELNLTQDQAQKLVDLQAGFTKQTAEKAAKAWKDTIDGWVNEAKSDKEFGGANFNTNLAIAKVGIKEFGDTQFSEMLEFTGVGNHPAMIRFLMKVGKVVKEADILQGSNRAGSDIDKAKILFPTMQ